MGGFRAHEKIGLRLLCAPLKGAVFAMTRAPADAPMSSFPEPVQRVAEVLAAAGHPQAPRWLDVAARTQLAGLSAGAPVSDVVTAPAPVRPRSPCTQVCRMDEATGWCQGCRRTLAEIAAWSAMDEAAREQVWLQLPARGS
jgi:predicted Fe-S protein YdhL (DUF1289 family)